MCRGHAHGSFFFMTEQYVSSLSLSQQSYFHSRRWNATLPFCCPLFHILLLSLILVVMWSSLCSPLPGNCLHAAFPGSSWWQGSQIWPGRKGVSQETEHKYRDPNNLITSGAIRSRILKDYPHVCVWKRAIGGVSGDWMVMKVKNHHTQGPC